MQRRAPDESAGVEALAAPLEELLRYEPPGTHIARYVARDVEWHGQQVPEGNALEEILKRFPEWEVDTEAAKLSPTSTVRGWETLPVVIP